MSVRTERLEATPRRETREPEAPAPAEPADALRARGPAAEVLALQRSAGNQAVGRLLQRSVKIGTAGGPIDEYDKQADVARLTAALNAKLAGMPAWVATLVGQQLPDLVTGAAPYDFDAAGDVVDWIVLSTVASGLLKFASDPMPDDPSTLAPGGVALKEAYTRIEALRAEYETAGEAAQTAPSRKSPFTVFGLTYQLEYGGPGHYYASRNNKTVVYSGFTRTNAKSLLNHLTYFGKDQKFGGKDEHVDNFVCSFLAEPSRWPEEQVFNLLSTSKDGDGDKQMVSADVAGTLPMAAGTTWNAEEGQVGRQLPKRALAHARSENIQALIDARMQRAQDVKKLTAFVARDLRLI